MTTSAHQSKVSSPWSDSHSAENSKGIDLGFSSLSIGGTVGSGARPPTLSVSSLSTFADDQPPPGHSRIVSDGTGNLDGSPPSPSSPLRTSRHSHGAMAGLSQSLTSDPGGHILAQQQQQQRGGMQSHPSPIGTRSVLDTGGGGNNNIASSPGSIIFESSPLVERSTHSASGSDSLFGSGSGRSHSQPFLSKGKLPPPPPTLDSGVDRDYNRSKGGGSGGGSSGGGGGVYGIGNHPRGGSNNSSSQDQPGGGQFIPLRMDRNDRGGIGALGGMPGSATATFSSSPTDTSVRTGVGSMRSTLPRLVSDSPRTTALPAVDAGAIGGSGQFHGRPPLSSHGPSMSSSGMGLRGNLPPPQDRLHDEVSNRERLPQHESDHYQGPHHPGSIAGRGRAVTTGSAGFDEMRGPPSRRYHPHDHGGSQGAQGFHDDPRSSGLHASLSSHGSGAGMYPGGSVDAYGRAPMDDHHPGDRGHNMGSYQQHPRSQVHHQHQMQQQPLPHQVQQQRFHGGPPPPDHMRPYSHGSEQCGLNQVSCYGSHEMENGYSQQNRQHGNISQRRSPAEGEVYDHQGGPAMYSSSAPTGGVYGGPVMPRSVSTGSNLRNVGMDGRMNRVGSVPSHMMASPSVESSSQSLDRSSGSYGPSSGHHHRQGGAGSDYSCHPHYHDSPRGTYSQRGSHDEPHGTSQGMFPSDHRLSHSSHHGREMGGGHYHGGMGHHHGGDSFSGGSSPVFLDDMGRLSSGMGQQHHGDNYDINGMRLPQRTGGSSMPRPAPAGVHHHPPMSHHGGHRRGQSLDTDLAGEHIEDPNMMDVMGPMDAPHLDAAGEHITSVYAHLPPQQSSSSLSSASGLAGPKVVYNVKFKRTQRSFVLGPRAPRDAVRVGAYVKVEADRGEDLGIVVGRMPADRYNAVGRFRPGGGVSTGEGCGGVDSLPGAAPPSPGAVGATAADLKRILRLATHDEVSLLVVKRDEEDELLKVCRSKVRQRGLPMTVVDAEYQFDRHKLTFFFEAEGRIDFRELVRDLFSIYKTRIWMQQLDKNCSGSSVSSGMASPTNGVDVGTACSADTIESEGSKELEEKDTASKSNDGDWNEKDPKSKGAEKQDPTEKLSPPLPGKVPSSTNEVF